LERRLVRLKLPAELERRLATSEAPFALERQETRNGAFETIL